MAGAVSENEQMRVAYELIDLPGLAAEFREGALPWTSVRELTRVVTRKTEDVWLDAIEGKRSGDASKIPAPTRRKVFVRDKFRCTVPWCTATRFLAIHHTSCTASMAVDTTSTRRSTNSITMDCS